MSSDAFPALAALDSDPALGNTGGRCVVLDTSLVSGGSSLVSGLWGTGSRPWDLRYT